MLPATGSTSKLSSPHQAVATLLLIENSSPMSTIWHVFRDRYIPSILKKLEGSNPATHSTFFIESSSLSPRLTVPPQLKVYQGGSGVLEFERNSLHKINAENIHSSIDMLMSVGIQPCPVALHLVIVAASAPSSDDTDLVLDYYNNHLPWLRLSERMAQEDVNCHLVLKVDQDMSPLQVLFEETLRLRRCHEAPPPFNVNQTEAIVRLTETRDSSPCPEEVAQAGIHSRRSPRRTRTYPPDSCTDKPHGIYPGTSQTQSELPSLVAQLQQRHGLTKKKVYGIKPPRAPFFRERDDPPLDPLRRTALPFPTALTNLSLVSPITLIPGGRSAPLSRLDRTTRLNQRSPTDTSRRWLLSASRLSSPENDAIVTSSSISTTETLSAANYERRVAPMSALPVDLPYRIPLQTDEQFTYSHTSYESGTESNWPRSQSGFMPQNYSTVSQPQHYNDSYTPSPPADVYVPQAACRSSPPTSQSLSAAEIRSMVQETPGVPYHDPISKSETSPQAPSSTSSKPHVLNPKDDEPFTFDAEYIAATTVMFRQEVLPAYPEYAELADSYGAAALKPSDGTSAQGYALSRDYSTLPDLPSTKAGQLYALKYSVAARQQRSAVDTSVAAASMPDYIDRKSVV